MRESVVDPFADFFRRYGWQTALLTLLFILLFKIPEQALVGGIMSPFYIDMGFTKTADRRDHQDLRHLDGHRRRVPRRHGDRALGRAQAAARLDRAVRAAATCCTCG